MWLQSFILCAEILGKMISNNSDTHGIVIDTKWYKISRYADDTQLFLNVPENSLREILDYGFTYNGQLVTMVIPVKSKFVF